MLVNVADFAKVAANLALYNIFRLNVRRILVGITVKSRNVGEVILIVRK